VADGATTHVEHRTLLRFERMSVVGGPERK